MNALVNLVGFGFIITGVAILYVSGMATSTGGAVVHPPVLPSDSGLPAAPRLAAPHPLTIRLSADAYGQFWIDGSANGAGFRFLADTGAADIVFGKHDAARIGIDVNRLSFDGRASTANGIVHTASTRLSHLTVGPFTAYDVPISINDGELAQPLLGMAFLRHMNVSISNGTLTLSEKP